MHKLHVVCFCICWLVGCCFGFWFVLGWVGVRLKQKRFTTILLDRMTVQYHSWLSL